MSAGAKTPERKRPLKVGVWLWTGEEDRGEVVSEVYVSDNDEVKLELALPETDDGEPQSISVYMSRAAATELGRQLEHPYEGRP